MTNVTTVPAPVAQRLLGRLPRGAILILYSLGFWLLLPGSLWALGWGLDTWLARPALPPSPLHWEVSLAVAILAVLLLGRSLWEFRVQAGEWPVSALPAPRLARRGVYGLLRHPIYLFYTLSAWGLSGLTSSSGLNWLVMPGFTALVLAYAWWEERELLARFGRSAQGHFARTGLVVPRLYVLFYWAARSLSRFSGLVRWLPPGVAPRPHPRTSTARPWIEVSAPPTELPMPAIVVAPHRCYLDPYFVGLALDGPACYVTTSSPLEQGWFRWLLARVWLVPRVRHRRDPACLRQILRALEDGYRVVVFPEGERAWAGGGLAIRRESLALLRRFPEVPILPIRIEGAYRNWPRWRNTLVRQPLSIGCGTPFFSRDFASAEALEAHLRECLTPPPPSEALDPMDSTVGLSRLLYRCADCGARLPTRDEPFRGCETCGAAFAVLAEGRVRFGNTEVASLSELAARCAAQAEPRGEGRARARQLPAPGLPSAEGWAQAVEVRLTLRESRLAMTSDSREATLDLAKVTSVTTEGNDRVRVTGGAPALTWELTPLGSSALEWQECLCLAVARQRGTLPNRT